MTSGTRWVAKHSLALADRVHALARGSIVLEAEAGEAELPDRLGRADLAPGIR